MNATEPLAHQDADAAGFKSVFEAMHASTRRSPAVERNRRQARLVKLGGGGREKVFL